VKILIIPKPDITFYDIFFDAGSIPRPNLARLKWYHKFNQVAYEYNFYSDISRVNKGETHIVGRLHPQYLAAPPSDCTNPSARLCPPVTSVRMSTAKRELSSYDAILCSSWSVDYVKDLLLSAKRASVFVTIIDHADHENIFLSRDQKELTRGLRLGHDFDLYLKKDLPLGMKNDQILPLGPDPVRPESYNVSTIPTQSNRNISVFFSGILNKPTTKEQRDGLLQEVARNVDSSYINIIDVDDHYAKKGLLSNLEINEHMSKSRVVLCAPGRAWTTTRLTTSAVFGCVPMVAEPDCELVDLDFTKNDLAIKYPNLRYLKGVQRSQAIDAAIKELNDALLDVDRLDLMAKNWREIVLKKHTTEARSKYIVECVKRLKGDTVMVEA
jgi:hypothetical protein